MLPNSSQFYKYLSEYKHWFLVLVIRLSILAALLTSNSAFAIGADYKLKAAYIYQFTKFTHWSDDVFENADSPIRICVIGRNPFGDALDGFASRKSQNRYLSVEYLKTVNDINRCQLVYISKSEEKKLSYILRHIAQLPVISVSDMDGFAHRGGIIGFIPKKRKVGIEINAGALHKTKVEISSKLLEVSTVVEGDEVEKAP